MYAPPRPQGRGETFCNREKKLRLFLSQCVNNIMHRKTDRKRPKVVIAAGLTSSHPEQRS